MTLGLLDKTVGVGNPVVLPKDRGDVIVAQGFEYEFQRACRRAMPTRWLLRRSINQSAARQAMRNGGLPSCFRRARTWSRMLSRCHWHVFRRGRRKQRLSLPVHPAVRRAGTRQSKYAVRQFRWPLPRKRSSCLRPVRPATPMRNGAEAAQRLTLRISGLSRCCSPR